tara:strand:+ start:8311 stop:9402 length:1092 start_codon:yes stop_codon:yes gene_type:complete
MVNTSLTSQPKTENRKVFEGEPSLRRPSSFALLQVGRGLAAILVVLFHTTAIFSLPKYWNSDPLGSIFLPGSSGVYFFFVLSGFIIFHAHSKDIGKPEKFFRYVGNRITRVYPMYWLVALISLFASIVLYKEQFDSLFLIGNFTLIPILGDKGNLAVAWSLFHEVVFYFLFSTLLINFVFGCAVLSAWAAGCLLSVFFDVPNDFLNVVFAPINLLFFLGLISYSAPKSGKLPVAMASGVLGISIFFTMWIFDIESVSDTVSSVVIAGFGVSSALIIWSAVCIENQVSIRVPRLFIVLGDASYSIYLIHFLALSLYAKILFRIDGEDFQFVFFISLAVLATVSGVLAHFLVERPMTRYIRTYYR